MALMDKRQQQGRRAHRRMHRRRPRTGLYIFVGLVVMALGSLAYLGLDPVSSGSSGPVERIRTPAVEGPRAAVSEKPADEARAEEQAASERAAAEEADRQRAEEERAAAEEQKAAAEEERAAAEERDAEVAVAPEDPTMYLTVPALGIDGVPVINDGSEYALEAGTQHVPSSGFPWEDGANTYIAGHRLGYPGTASDRIFYNLPTLGSGDEVTLTDSNGEVYNYQVSEVLEVTPQDTWVMSPVADRDIVSLQTCIENIGDYWTEGPNWSGRYVVRADRV